jgi:SAM-dependent methyltransferase
MSVRQAPPQIRDRIVGLRRVRADKLLPNPKNWRRHPKAQGEALKGLLQEIGYADALLARETPDGLMLIDGHLRAETTPKTKVPVLVLDLDEAEADKLLLTLDPLAAMAEMDGAATQALLEGVQTESEGVRAMLAGIAAKAERPSPWQPPHDDGGEGDDAVEMFGWNLASFWPAASHEQAPYWVHMLPLPHHDGIKPGSFKQTYSRTGLWELDHIVRLYTKPGDRFMELCVGWGTFSSVAKWYGRSGMGCDIWPVSIDFCHRQIEAMPGDGDVEIINADATATGLPGESFDFIYCNPPFFQLESYGDDDRQLAARPTYDEWLAGMGELTAEAYRLLRPGSLAVFTMNDFRARGRLLPAHCDWVRLGGEAGFVLHDLAVSEVKSQLLRLRKREALNWQRTVKCHEYILVFRRPN